VLGGPPPRIDPCVVRDLIDHPTQRMSALYYDCLLGLPDTSDAFSAHPKIVNVPKNKGLEKPPSSANPRKTPKLTRDADSASASRSREVGAQSASRNTGGMTRRDDDVIMRDAADEDAVVSVVLRIEGAPCTSPPIHYLAARPNVCTILDKPASLVGQYTSECYTLITRFLRYYLTKPRSLGATLSPPPNSSFENIFTACRTIVSTTKDPGDLHDQVRMQLERCVGELAQDLGDKKEKGVRWIKPFNETCAWFEGRVVSADRITPRLEVQTLNGFISV
jgi:cullin-4